MKIQKPSRITRSSRIFCRGSLVALTILLWMKIATLADPPQTFTATITNGANTVTVNFVHHPIRGADFAVLVQDASGNFVTNAAPEARTYIGSVVNQPGAIACGLLLPDNTLWSYVIFEAGDQWFSYGPSNTEWRYGTPTFTPKWPTSAIVTSNQSAAVTNVVAGQVGVDIPYSTFIGVHDGSVDHVVYVHEFNILQTDLIYLRDIGFLHTVGRIVIRGDQNADPYKNGNQLGVIRYQWTFVIPGNEAVAYVSVPGYGGGVSLLGTVCDHYSGVAVADTDGMGNPFIVWRHEVGHNHGAGDGQGGYCENFTLMNANQLGRMSGPEEATMLASRNGGPAYGVGISGCLLNLGSYAFELPPRASLDLGIAEPAVPLTIDVMANDHDSNGDTFSISSFDLQSTFGATIARSTGTGPGGRDQVTYTSPDAFPQNVDNFQYRIQDSLGYQGLGNVFVKHRVISEVAGYWTLDDGSGASVRDSGSMRLTGAITGAPVWRSEDNGSSLEFTNGTSGVGIPALDLNTNTVTITCWIKRNGSQSAYAGLVFSRAGSTTAGLVFGTNNELRYHWNDSATNTWGFNSNLVVPDNTWTFCALVVEPSQATLYLDSGTGLQSAVNSVVHNIEAFDGPLSLGYDPCCSERHFLGTLDDVCVFRRALTTTEINAMAQGGGPAGNPIPIVRAQVGSHPVLGWTAPPAALMHDVYFGQSYVGIRDATTESSEFKGSLTNTWFDTGSLTMGGFYYWRVDERCETAVFKGPLWYFTVGNTEPIAHWRLDELSGTTATDSTGTNNGVYVNSPSLGQPGANTNTSTAVAFNGTNQYVEAIINVSETNYSAVLWFKTTQANGGLFSVSDGSNGWDRAIYLSNGNVAAYTWNSETIMSTGLSLGDGQWHHIAHTFGDAVGGQKLYVDGVLIASGSKNQSDFTWQNRVRLGYAQAGGYFNGTLDDVQIYDRALSAAEIQNLYKSTDLSLTVVADPSPVIVGSNLTYTITVSNNGSINATSVAVTGTLPANVTYVSSTASQGSCSHNGYAVRCSVGTLVTNSTATIQVVVTPTTYGTLHCAAVASLAEGDPNPANNSAAINTTAYIPAHLSVSPSSADLGRVQIGSSSQTSFVVTNSGSETLTGSVTGTGPFSIVSGATLSVPGFGSATVTVQFSPTATGAANDTVSFTSNGGNSNVSLTGEGYIPAHLVVTPAGYDFGNVFIGSAPQTSFVVTNTGSDALAGTATAATPFAIVSGGTYTVAGFGSTTVTVNFTPTTSGAATGSVSFVSNGGNIAPTLTGTAAWPPPVANFSASPTSGSAALTVTFSDSSMGNITSRSWNFGNGVSTNITGSSATSIYRVPGSYTVQLIVTGPGGSSTNTQTNVIVVAAPMAATWINSAASGNWSDPFSWDVGAVPGTGATVTLGLDGSASVVDTISRTVGTLVFNRAGNFSLNTSGGGTLTISTGVTINNDYGYTITTPITLAQSNSWVINGNGSLTVSGVISGTATLNKTGSGILILTGANNYSGGTAVNGGVLQIGVGTTAGVIASGSAVSIGASGTVKWNNNNSTSGLTLANAVSGSGTLLLQGQNATNSLQTSVYTLSGNNSGFSGTLSLNGAMLWSTTAQSQIGGALIDVQTLAAVAFNGGTFNNAITIGQGAGWHHNVGGDVVLGAIRMEGNNTLSGNITLNNTNHIVIGNSTGLNSTVGGWSTGTHHLAGVLSGQGDFAMSRFTSWNSGSTQAVNIYLDGTQSNTYTGYTVVDGQGAVASLWLNKTGGAAAIAGGTTVQMGSGTGGQANLRMGQNQQFGTNNGGVLLNFVNASGQWMRFDLKATSQTLAGLNAGATNSQAGAVIQNQGIDGIAPSGSGTLTLNGGGTYLYNGYIRDQDNSGTTYKLNLVLSGAGRQTLAGSAVSYTGSTVLNSGSLTLRATSAFNSPVAFNGGALVLDSTGGDTILAQPVSGTAGTPVLINGANANWVRLKQENPYTGGWLVNSNGWLLLGNNTTAGSVQGVVTNNGVLGIYRNDAYTFTNNVIGVGSLSLYSPGGNAATVSNNTVYLGGTVTVLGTDNIASATVTANTLSVQSATLNILPDANATFASSQLGVSGGGRAYLNIYGGSLTFLGGNGAAWSGSIYDGWDSYYTITQTGGVLNALGMIAGDHGGSSGTDYYTMSGGKLVLGSTGIITPVFKAPWGATVNLNLKLSGGTISASANWQTVNNYYGSGTVSIDLTNVNGNVTFDTASFGITINSPMTGVGGLNKTGAGTLTIAGGGSFSGAMTANAGTLLVTSSLTGTGTCSVANGAVLAGQGTVSGAVTSSGTVAPGPLSGPGTMRFNGSYTQTSSGKLSVRIGSSSSFDRLSVGGSAALDGTLTVQLLNGYSPAIGTTFRVLTAPTQSGQFSATNLAALPTNLAWVVSCDATGAVLTVVGRPTFTSDPITKPAANEAQAYSDSLAGNATDPNTGYAMIFSKVSGPSWLTVASTGALTGTPASSDSGTNSFVVGVTDQGGLSSTATMKIYVNGAPSFTSNPITKPAAIAGLAYADSITSAVTDPNPGDTLTFAKVSGPTWLTVGANGALSGVAGSSDDGANSFIVSVTDPRGLSATATLSITVYGTVNSGALVFTQPMTWTLNGSDSLLQSGVISGSGALTKNGTGTLVLGADNTYTGGTLVSTGILQIGNGGAAGTLGTGAVTNNSTLTFNRSDNYTFSGTLRGTGSVIQNGLGNLTLSGAGISYTGATIVNAGTLTLRATSAFNSPVAFNGGALVLDSTGGDAILLQAITGTATTPILVNGANANWVRLTQNSPYTGGWLVNSNGWLLLGNNTTAGSVQGVVTNNGVLGIYRNDAYSFTNNLVGNGALTLYQSGGNTLLVNGNTINLGALNGYAGTLTNTSVNLTGNLNFGGGTGQTGLTIQDGASVTVAGLLQTIGNSYNYQTMKIYGGTLTANGYFEDAWDTAYSVIQTGGVVRVGGMRSTGYWGGWARNNSYTLNGGTLIVGNYGIVQNYYGLYLYLGGGTLSASTNWSLSANTVLTNGTVTVDTAGYAITFNWAVTGNGGLTKTGAGTLTLVATNTFTGPTTVSTGTLVIISNTGTGLVSVATGATLISQGTLGGAVTSSGTVMPGTVSTPGILNLGGDYAQDTNATLNVRISGTNSFGKVSASGTATLGGTLAVQLVNGFLPALSNSFRVVSTSSRSGQFTTNSFASPGTGKCWKEVYDTTGLTLNVESLPVLAGISNTVSLAYGQSTDPSVTGQPTVTDLVDPNPSVGFNDTTVTGSCQRVITRVWTATNSSGNAATVTQTITVASHPAPVIISGCPTNITIPLPSNYAVPNLCSSLVATSELGAVQVTQTPGTNTTIFAPSTVIRDWAGTNTGTLVNANLTNAFVAGKVGPYALQLDGVNDYVDLGTGPSISGSGDFSVCAWVKTTSGGLVLCQRSPGPTGYYGGYYFSVSGGKGLFQVYTMYYADHRDALGTTTINDGQWHHLVGVRSHATGWVLLYVDGKLEGAAGDFSFALDGGTRTYIGANMRDGNGFYNGSVDEVAIFRRALTADEAATMYANPAQVVRSQPIAHYRMDEAVLGPVVVNTAASDSCGGQTACAPVTVQATVQTAPIVTITDATNDCLAGIDPSVTGQAQANGAWEYPPLVTYQDARVDFPLNQIGLQLILLFNENPVTTNAVDGSGNGLSAQVSGGVTATTGALGGAYNFNGVNGIVTLPLNVSETSYAVSFWFQTTHTGVGMFSVTADQESGGHDRHVYLNGSNIAARVWNNEVITSTGLNLADGQWHHVVHTFGGMVSGQKLYVDGVLVASGNKSWSDFNLQTTVRIGRSVDAASPNFNGAMDDVVIWSRAVGADEVGNLYRSGLRGHGAAALLTGFDSMQVVRTWTATDQWGLTASVLQTITITNALADVNNDGISVGQAMVYGTDPTKTDSNGDGIPDAWAVAHNLNPLDSTVTDSITDSSGWTWLQKYVISRYPAMTNHTDAVVVTGSQATTNQLGRWTVDSSDIYAVDRRGYVEYAMNVTTPDIYRLQVDGTQNISSRSSTQFDLILSVDGQYLGRYTLTGGYGTIGNVGCLTPYLTSGTHIVRVFWDNASSRTSLRIKTVKLQSMDGTVSSGNVDSNGNSVKDWVASLVALDNKIVTGTNSYTSPAFIEGRGLFLTTEMASAIFNEYSTNLTVNQAPNNHWYVNAPLSTNGTTGVIMTFENGGLVQTQQINWVAKNILDGGSLAIRNGDSLLFTTAPAGSTNGTMNIVVSANGQTVASYGNISYSSPLPYLFPTSGVYTVTGSFTDGIQTRNGTLTVTVLSYAFSTNPDGWVAAQRVWAVPPISPGVVLEADPRLGFIFYPSIPSHSLLTIRQQPSLCVASRVSTNGPILATATTSGFRFWSSNRTYLTVVKKYDDGSSLMEMLVVVSPMLPDMTVNIGLIYGGVTFDDGTTYKTLTASDFDALGQYHVRFLLGAGQPLKICHYVNLSQNGASVGGY